ncbi:DUF4142 domain-containing protein [Actinomadura rupiterrae]|uniref:DUF4142 domain-containing protein n=1 Tax=Actinomadura rupiterrae TaxID=559627 RepID=UPI0020A499D1|nr:DUF4142 domain-containing protein [Actinomadura rupiterrae]MCP2338478.1 putative outer membrane protein [Actinomadura rupiterrae]
MRTPYGRTGFRSGLRIPRWPRRARLLPAAAAVTAVAAAVLTVLSPPGIPSDGGPATGTVGTRWGPLSPQDRILLVKVRQAGLWEMPAGQQAAQRASDPRVKRVGDMIMSQHLRLDADVRGTAQKLGVILPNQPNTDQQRWLKELSGKFGADYDRDFVFRLRAAHGKVFAVIAQVRAQTQNSEIRAFAERAMTFVNTHMRLLESTGLVTRQAVS